RRGAAPTATAAPGRRRGAVTDVVKVRAKQHVGVLQLRIATLDHPDDVLAELSRDDFVGVVDVDSDFRANRARRQILTFLRLRLDVRELLAGCTENKLVELVVARDDGWDDAVDLSDGRHIWSRRGGRAAAACRCRPAATTPARSASRRSLRVGDSSLGLRQRVLGLLQRQIRRAWRGRRRGITEDDRRTKRLNRVVRAVPARAAAPACRALG